MVRMSEHLSEPRLGSLVTPDHEPVQLWSIIDFQRWWYAMEERFLTPIGRKLLYAVSDAEEDLLRRQVEYRHRWYRRRTSLEQRLAERRLMMGWGRFEFTGKVVYQPIHDLIEAGSGLAHLEHLYSQRFTMTWQQHNEGTMSLSCSPKAEPMTSVGTASPRNWCSVGPAVGNDGAMDVEISRRDVGFFVNDQRHFLLPSTALSYLYDALLSVEPRPNHGPPGLVMSTVDPSEVSLFHHVAGAAFEAVTASNRMVFFDSQEQLAGVLRTHVHRHGMGGVVIETFQAPNHMTLRLTGAHTPLLAGWTFGLLRLASGERMEGRLSSKGDVWYLAIQPEKVSFDHM